MYNKIYLFESLSKLKNNETKRNEKKLISNSYKVNTILF